MRRILMLPEQASTMARDIDLLHYAVILSTLLGATAVTVVAGVFIVRYRAKDKDETRRGAPRAAERTRAAVPIWAEVVAIAFLLSLFLVFWIVGYKQLISLQRIPEDAIDIHVVGKKWMWSFAYPNGAGSNATLYVPARRPIKLIITSRDVIHSFYLPQFRLKQDAVPGQATLAWFEAKQPGTYDIFCAEYCGTGHSAMLGQVQVVPPEQYERILRDLPAVPIEGEQILAGREGPGESASLAQVGERIAGRRGCMRCHTADGTAHLGPTWAGLFGSKVRLDSGEEITVDEAYLTESMMDPLAKLRLGYEPIMPSYRGLLSAGEAGAIVEFIRALRESPPEQRLAPLSPSTAPSNVSLPQAEPAARPARAEIHQQTPVPVPQEAAPFPAPEPGDAPFGGESGGAP